jgi:hypothetical protein
MLHSTATTTRRNPRANRKPSRRTRNTVDRSLGFGLDALEPRVVPTVVFSPLYGTEQTTDGNGWKVPNATIQLVFWGSYWNTTQGVTDEFRDITDATSLSSSGYFSGLQQYVGGVPHVSVASTAVVDTSSPGPPGSVNDATMGADVTGELELAVFRGPVPAPRSFGSSTPLYVVITPPTTVDTNDGGLSYDVGWNTNETLLVPTSSQPYAATVPLVWCSSPSSADQVSTTLGHELAEVMTDPSSDGAGITLNQGATESKDPLYDKAADNQIGDHEARDWGYRIASGMLVQPYWSQRDQAYIAPDGNSFQFNVGGGTHTTQFSEGSGSTLTILGGQNGLFTNDTVTLDQSNGVVTATYDGQTVQFDSGAIKNVNVDEVGFGSLNVNITGSWSDSKATQTPITVVASPLNATTINVTAAAGALASLPHGLLNVYDAANKSTLTINDQADASNHSWTLNGGIDGIDGQPLVTYAAGGPSQLTVNTGAGTNDVDVEASPCPTNLNLGNSGGRITFAAQSQNLAAISSPVFLTGYANSLSFDDQADATSQSVTFEKGFVLQGNMAPVFFGGVGSIGYFAGTGNDTFSAAPSTKNMEGLAPSLSIFGGPGNDSLTINDTGDANPLEFESQYTETGVLFGASITRVYAEILGSQFLSFSNTITYQGLSGGVIFDTDNNGTPVDVEGTAIPIPTTIDVGSGNTAVTIGAQTRSLATLGSILTVNGGTGVNTLTVYDQLDPYASAAPYQVWSGWVARNLPITPYFTGVTFKGFRGAVTLDTDNNGTPVEIEGMSAPTKINVGSGNTSVNVAEFGQSLAPFTYSSFALSALTLNGGSGADSLIVNDQQELAASGTISYTVTAGSITRVDRGYRNLFFSEAIVNYQNFRASVTLNTDDNGTPVDVEGTSAPTTINVGTGNTAVSVTASGQNLYLLGSDLTVNGGTGTDSLVVNDSLDPNASSSSRYGSSLYSYAVTGQAISRTWNYSGLYRAWSTRSINYNNVKNVTFDTDNNGTPVDVEGTSAPTTVNAGSGTTAISVTATGQNLCLLTSDLTVIGGTGTDSLNVNDQLNPLVPTSSRYSSSSYNYTVSGQAISRTWNFYGLIHGWSTRSINYANIKGGVTLQTDSHNTPVNVSGAAGPNAVTVVCPTGSDTLSGPTLANSWNLTGANAGALDGWVNFVGFANLNGGGLADSFDFSPAGSVSGNINGQGGNDLLNYVRVSTPVTVNLATGKATGVGGTVAGIQGVVGGSGNNALTGSGRSLLIGGAGASQLVGGSSDSLMIAGSTIYGLQDAALEAILTEWDRTDIGFTQRVTDLTSGGGLNGSCVLTLSTVNSNGKVNTITCGTGQAWIFAKASDLILLRKPSDQLTLLAGN